MTDLDDFRHKLDGLPDSTIVRRLSEGVYSDPAMRAIAVEIIEARRHEAATVLAKERDSVARSVMRAAWLSALAALLGLVVSVGALIVSVTALAHST